MSDFLTNRGDFTVIDFRGNTDTLSSYNLSITPLKFQSKSLSYIGERTKIVWDFGDGTKTEEKAPSHYYTAPGIYRTRLIYYDCKNNGVVGEVYKDIVIKEYISDTFTVSIANNILSGVSGGLSTPITITQTVPHTAASTAIQYSVSGSSTPWYFTKKYKYSHLAPHHSLFATTYIDGTAVLEPILTLKIAINKIYGRIVNNELVTSSYQDPSSIIIGYSGTQTVFYRDDSLSGRYALNFNRATALNYNTFKTTVTGIIFENQNVNHLSITSNGIDGDSIPITTYKISPIKLEKTKIPFVVKIKDTSNNTIKNFFSPISTNNISVRVNGENITSYKIGSLLHTITGIHGEMCSFRGFVEFDEVLSPLSSVQIYSEVHAINNASTDFGVITGISAPFTVYPKNYYSLVKINENYDMSSSLKSLGMAEPLIGKDVFYDKFLGTILGNNTDDIDGLGKKAYERISNFVNNTTNIDTCDIVNLESMCRMFDRPISVFDNTLMSYPASMKRIINLLSLNKHKLFGTDNKFVQNFKDNGDPGSGRFGINLGPEIDVDTFISLPFKDRFIVAYEKFSEKYILLNAFQPLKDGSNINNIPLDQEDSSTIITEDGVELFIEGAFYLKNYETTWGWPLVLPTEFNSKILQSFYIFYEFNNIAAGNTVGGVIDFDISTVKNNISYKELYNTGGVVDNIIINTLYLSLSLTK